MTPTRIKRIFFSFFVAFLFCYAPSNSAVRSFPVLVHPVVIHGYNGPQTWNSSDSVIYPIKVFYTGWKGDTAAALSALRGKLSSLVTGRAFDHGTTSVRVVLFEPDGRLHNVFAKNPSLAVMPASVEKMFTSSSTLWALGSKYAFATKLDLGPKARLENGVVHGDLILRPSGDPTFRSIDLDQLADQIRAQGITSITGDILSDLSGEDVLTPEAKKYFAQHTAQPIQTKDSSFDSGSMLVSENGVQPSVGTSKENLAKLPSEIPPSALGAKAQAIQDGSTDSGDSATSDSSDEANTDEDADQSDPGALSAYPNFSLDRNVVSVTITAGSHKGAQATVRVWPPIPQIAVLNHAGTSAPATRVRKRIRKHRKVRTVIIRTRGKYTLHVSSVGELTDAKQVITVSGVLPARSSRTYSFAIRNVPLAMAAILKYKLSQKGVHVSGVARAEKVVQPASSATSPIKTVAQKETKLMDLLMQMNKRSDNYLAESMFRKLSTIASVAANAPDERARKLMHSWLEVCNAEGKMCTFIDGSGLSHANRVTANTVIELLKGIRDQGMFDLFTRTLSIAGYDGTLRARMIGTPAQYNAHGKTGTLSNVTALAGYVVTGDGQLAAYFITMQNFRGGLWGYKRTQNDIVATLAAFKYQDYLPIAPFVNPGTQNIQNLPAKTSLAH